MSTIDRARGVSVPPLVEGERLDQATFHERYEAMPPETQAELIGGVVVMASPVGRGHRRFAHLVSTWVGHFEMGLAGLEGGTEGTTMLDELAEVQPDILLRVRPEYGGRTRDDINTYIVGPPELVVEVANTSKSTDLGRKFDDYQRTGVLEYLVVTLDPEAVHWFARRGDRLEPLPPGPDGLFRSEAFPGLWLDPVALFADDIDRLLAALDRGKATPEHAAFRDAMAARRRP